MMGSLPVSCAVMSRRWASARRASGPAWAYLSAKRERICSRARACNWRFGTGSTGLGTIGLGVGGASDGGWGWGGGFAGVTAGFGAGVACTLGSGVTEG